MCCYYYNMLKKPLIETNPYLRVPETYRKSLITSVSSSTAIETATSVQSISEQLTKSVNDIWPLEIRSP
jgi:hypothetical protein